MSRCHWCEREANSVVSYSGHSFCSRRCLTEWQESALGQREIRRANTIDFIQYGWRQPLIGRRRKVRRITYLDGHVEEENYEWTQAEIDQEK